MSQFLDKVGQYATRVVVVGDGTVITGDGQVRTVKYNNSAMISLDVDPTKVPRTQGDTLSDALRRQGDGLAKDLIALLKARPDFNQKVLWPQENNFGVSVGESPDRPGAISLDIYLNPELAQELNLKRGQGADPLSKALAQSIATHAVSGKAR